MAFKLLYVAILSGNIFKEICTDSHGHFPLNNCSEDELDILTLLESEKLIQQEHFASIWSFYNNFAKLFLSPESKRVRGAIVFDRSTTHTVSRNISVWRFRTLTQSFIHLDATTEPLRYRVTDVNTVIELKMQFVERLFTEMGGVRQTAIHVGVIFLAGADLTQEEIRSVPSIVQLRNTDVKIFVVIVGSKLVEDIVHLTDTIVLPTVGYRRLEQILLMAMCKQCLPGWVSGSDQKFSTIVQSCYKLNSHEAMTWTSAMTMCNTLYSGFLARIETVEEMQFLQSVLYKMIKENVTFNFKDIYKQTADVYIGLHRDFSTYARRFQWLTNSGKYLPLAIHHWLPGNPAHGFGRADCALWRFQGNWSNDHHANMTDGFAEGWIDISCDFDLKYNSLCEVVLPQQTDNNNIIRPESAPQDSFNVAFGRGDFLTFQHNIVSVYENVGNKYVLQSFRKTTQEHHMFDCAEDTGQQWHIPYSLVCDYVDHCRNRRDETYCFQHILYFPSELYCASGKRCWDGSCLPVQWLNDGVVDCLIYNHETYTGMTDEDEIHDIHLKDYKTCAFICNSDICVGTSKLNDRFIDCIGPEGALDETIGKLKVINTCKNSMSYFIWAPKCVYIKDIYGGLMGCRDMSHLRDCESFQCDQGYVKCFDSYCIPQHYLLDMKADCPTGEDEQPFYTGQCIGNFACWKSKVCLHPDLVCDGRFDCPHKDDELNCNKYCPEGFHCTAGTVLVSNHSLSSTIDFDSFANIGTRTRYLDLSGIDLSQVEDFFSQAKHRFIYVVVLILSQCKISNINVPENETLMHHSQFNIQRLDISNNMIQEMFNTELFNDIFPYIRNLNVSYNNLLVSVKHLNFSFLEIMDLSHTGLSYLTESVFSGMPSLKHLNLSHTLISDFNKQYFHQVFTLHTLDLRHILIENWEQDLFHGLAISHNLYTDHYQICCPKIRGYNIPSHACHSPTDAISSCSDLIGLFVQRVLLWMVAVIAVLGNLSVIVYRVICDRSVLKTGYGLFVTNLGISDFIMGVYLFIIAGADYFYRDNFVLYDKNWRESNVCTFAGIMATVSHEASTLFTFLITLDRVLVIKFPFGQPHFSIISRIMSVILVWVISFLLSLIPILFTFSIYSSNAMCLGLPLTIIKVKGWEYSVGVFVIYNFILFLLIAYGQYAIFRAMSQNKISNASTSMSSSRRAEDITVAKKLSLVVLSNFLCWFPIGLMGLMSLGGCEVSNEVYAWTTVLLLPINSAANPVLYTIPALIARWEQFKYGHQIDL